MISLAIAVHAVYTQLRYSYKCAQCLAFTHNLIILQFLLIGTITATN